MISICIIILRIMMNKSYHFCTSWKYQMMMHREASFREPWVKHFKAQLIWQISYQLALFFLSNFCLQLSQTKASVTQFASSWLLHLWLFVVSLVSCNASLIASEMTRGTFVMDLPPSGACGSLMDQPQFHLNSARNIDWSLLISCMLWCQFWFLQQLFCLIRM